jgi:plasmid maintenance system killer protein
MMIPSFGDKQTNPFLTTPSCGISGARRATRKPEAVNAASRLTDLSIPPSNHLERLQGLEGFPLDPD